MAISNMCLNSLYCSILIQLICVTTGFGAGILRGVFNELFKLQEEEYERNRTAIPGTMILIQLTKNSQ